jgi:hypothetical protein
MGDIYVDLTIANVHNLERQNEPIVGTHVLQDFRMVVDMERHMVSCSRARKAK